jgi:hypothetical protein
VSKTHPQISQMAQIREGPITFAGEMVRAILEDRKTQTRRAIRPQPPVEPLISGSQYHPGDRLWVRENWRVGAWSEDRCAIAVDYKADSFSRQEWIVLPDEDQFERLWLQSTDDAIAAGRRADEDGKYHWDPGCSPCRWRSSRFMPKVLARIRLEILSARLERLQDISEQDCGAEGVQIPVETIQEPPVRGVLRTSGRFAPIHYFPNYYWGRSHPMEERTRIWLRAHFASLWDSLHARDGHGWREKPWVWVITFKRLDPATTGGLK